MCFVLYLCLENCFVIFYTCIRYEDFKSLFFTAIGGNLYNVVADFNRLGMDDADYVHDEVLVKIWN